MRKVLGGILNIVTVGSGLEGYTATFSANVSNRGAGGGAFGTIKSGKLTVSARYNYNYNDQPRNYSSGSQHVTVGEAVTENSSDLDYDGSKQGPRFLPVGQHGGQLRNRYTAAWSPCLSDFGAAGTRATALRTTLATFPENINAAPIYSYSAFNRSKSSWYSIDGGIDYQRLFPGKGAHADVLVQD